MAQGHDNAILRNHMLNTVAVYSVTDCGLLCSRDQRCRSFNLCADRNKLLCELNNATNEDFREDFDWTINCSYYSTIVRSTF